MRRFRILFQTLVHLGHFQDHYQDHELWIDADDQLEAINTVLSMVLPVDGIEIHSVEMKED